MTCPTKQSARVLADTEAQMRAHNIAIDRLCMNLLTGGGLAGVREEYREALDIERRVSGGLGDV